MLVLVGFLAASAIVWVALGPKFVLAPVLGLAVYAWGTATLRSFRRGAHGADLDELGREPEPVSSDDERTLYWCEECRTELLLVVRGNGQPPRHCGSRMHERIELPR